MPRPSHRIKNLQTFLDRLDLPNSDVSSLAITLALFIGAPLGVIFVSNLEDGGRFVWVVFALLVAVSSIIASIQIAHRRRLAKRQREYPQAHELSSEFYSVHKDGSLEERLDPTVGDELDACAAAYLEIGQILERPEWQRPEGHRASAKTSVLSASDALMADALLIGAGGLRAKGMRRDAFAKRMANPAIKTPLMESLGRVRHGLQALRSQLGSHSAAKDSLYELESALSQLTEIRRAEEELGGRHLTIDH